MSREVTLSFGGDKPKETYEVPISALILIKALAPIANSEGPIPFEVGDEIDAKVFRNVIKWLRRDAHIGELISDMNDFRATVRFADKYDIRLLLDDLDLWYCGTMLTMPKLLGAISSHVDILVKCETCGSDHKTMSTQNMYVDTVEKKSADVNLGLTYHHLPQQCGTKKCCVTPRFHGCFAIIETMLAQGNYDDDAEPDDESVEPLDDYHLAAEFEMKQMLIRLLPYTLYMTKRDKCERVMFFRRLYLIDTKIASEWACAAFEQHSGNCFGHHYFSE